MGRHVSRDRFLFRMKKADYCTDKMQAAVCDGDTIGHPCCAVHDCKVPLASHHHRFCPDHSSLNEICAVTTCELPIAAGFRTCADPAHRALEKRYFSRGEAFFQLRSKLKKAGVAVPSDSVPLAGDTGLEVDEEVSIEQDDDNCNAKAEEGNRRLKAYFGRHRTHNDQLWIRTCGIILSRATFYGSEAVSAFVVSFTYITHRSAPVNFRFDRNLLRLLSLPSSQHLNWRCMTLHVLSTSFYGQITTHTSKRQPCPSTSFTSAPSTRIRTPIVSSTATRPHFQNFMMRMGNGSSTRRSASRLMCGMEDI